MAKRAKTPVKRGERNPDFDKMSPIEREEHLIRLAEDVAEEQLRNGTASAQVITQYLRLGSSRERIEQHNKELEGELLEAKTELARAGRHYEELLSEAMEAFKSYSGSL